MRLSYNPRDMGNGNLPPDHNRFTQFVLLLFLMVALAACRQAAPDVALVTAPPAAAAQAALTAVSTPLPLPPRDLVTLAAELTGLDAPRVARTTAAPYQVGDVETFWFKNLAAGRSEQIEARLAVRTAALNLWVQTGARVADADLQAAAAVLEQQVLPTNRAFFGQEWSPGIDGDVRINVLHLKELGGVGIAYFSAADEVVSAINPYSNERELLYVSLKDVKVGDDLYFATIAHELQHLIQWHTDQNEAAWLEEGLSELAVHVNGYPTGREKTYAENPDIPLTNLRQEPDVIAHHYAASFLFAAYFRDRFGEAATQALVRHPEGSMAGVAAVLADVAPDMTPDALFADWLAASYLQGIGRGTGVYRYDTVSLPPLATTDVGSLPAAGSATVSQYGADYLRIRGAAPVTAVFTGTQQVPAFGAPAHSGQLAWVSYPADKSAMHLTRAFDLRGLDQATLTFWTWYAIEEGWDYAYLAVSADDGRSWQLLETPSTTAANPQGNSFGPGYTGISGGGAAPVWVRETADLTPYAGHEILLRFLYITDDAVHDAGFAIDDVAIPELGFADDAESPDAGWVAAGFVRMTDMLPQRFLALLILPGDEVRVEPLPLDATQRARWHIPLSPANPEAILVIAGLTPFTAAPAAYAYEITQP